MPLEKLFHRSPLIRSWWKCKMDHSIKGKCQHRSHSQIHFLFDPAILYWQLPSYPQGGHFKATTSSQTLVLLLHQLKACWTSCSLLRATRDRPCQPIESPVLLSLLRFSKATGGDTQGAWGSRVPQGKPVRQWPPAITNEVSCAVIAFCGLPLLDKSLTLKRKGWRGTP